MNHPSRDVNGSSRILYRVLGWERDHARITSYPCEAAPMKRTTSELRAGQIREWSPSGDRLDINGFWYERTDVELVEVLP